MSKRFQLREIVSLPNCTHMSYVVRHIYDFRHQWLHGDRAARMFSVKQLVLKSNQHHIRVLFFAFTDPSKSKDTRNFRNANGIIAAHGLFLSMCVKVRHRMKKHIMINIALFSVLFEASSCGSFVCVCCPAKYSQKTDSQIDYRKSFSSRQFYLVLLLALLFLVCWWALYKSSSNSNIIPLWSTHRVDKECCII